MENKTGRNKLDVALGSLQALIGLGAVGGGFLLITDPSGEALGLPLSLLEKSPFPDFLIPGLFLLAVNGIGSLIGAGLSFTGKRYAPESAMILGAILVAWIVIQVAMIRSVGWLHVLYFILGFTELGMGWYIRRHR